MIKKTQIGLILMILSLLIGSATVSAIADKSECFIVWQTNTKGPTNTTVPIGGNLDAFYIEGGIENICTGVIPFDHKHKGASLFTLEEACVYFYGEDQCVENPETLYLDNTVIDGEAIVVDPENSDLEYLTNIWNLNVDSAGNFTFTKIYYYP